MFSAVHAVLYAEDPEAARLFFRDILGLPFVDAGGGWLIFKTGPSEVGIHPTRGEHGGEAWSITQHHELALMCDDIDATVEELQQKGVEITSLPSDRGFGRTATFRIPGAGEMMIYEPRHPVAYGL